MYFVPVGFSETFISRQSVLTFRIHSAVIKKKIERHSLVFTSGLIKRLILFLARLKQLVSRFFFPTTNFFRTLPKSVCGYFLS